MPPGKSTRGRPKKYGRPARAVTFTLPEDVLARLSGIDADVGRAIVRLVERQPRPRWSAPRTAELSSYGNHAVIIVNPASVLKRLPGVELVPIGNGRALISLGASNSVEQLELALRDALERTQKDQAARDTLEAIAGVLRRARVSRDVSVEPRTIIVLARTRSGTTRSGSVRL